jgi:cytochrome c-type biogenesis protein CcmH/NrfG
MQPDCRLCHFYPKRAKRRIALETAQSSSLEGIVTPLFNTRTPHARLGVRAKSSPEEAKRAHDEIVGFLEEAPESLRSWARDQIAAADGACAALTTAGRGSSPLRRLVFGLAALAATVGVVIAVYNSGGDKGEAQPQGGGAAGGAALNPGDEVRVAQLRKKLETHPRDAATLIQLGNVFFEAGDYGHAGSWMKRAVAVDPGNVSARLALGASEFNLGDAADARRDWLRVIAADPKNVEAYYDLGFLYVSQEPPDMAGARKMWGKVVELAPNSSVAKTVATHLKGLEGAGAETGSAR